MEVKLSTLRPGQFGTIRSFSSNDMHIKLMEMGCLPGERVVLEKIAPLGDPISVRVSGYSLSLRLDEADQIIVDIDN